MPKPQSPYHNLAALDIAMNAGIKDYILTSAVADAKPYRFRAEVETERGRDVRVLTSEEFALFLLVTRPRGWQFKRLFAMNPTYWVMRLAGACTDIVRESRRGAGLVPAYVPMARGSNA